MKDRAFLKLVSICFQDIIRADFLKSVLRYPNNLTRGEYSTIQYSGMDREMVWVVGLILPIDVLPIDVH